MILLLLAVGLALLHVVGAQDTSVEVTNPALVFRWTPDEKPPIDESYVRFKNAASVN